MAGIHDFQLDPSIFNQDLYTRVLQLYLATYPDPCSVPSKEDLRRWFGFGANDEEKAAYDQECHAVAMPALSSLGPDKLALPPFESPSTEHKLFPVLAAPFVGEFTNAERKPESREREDAALPLVVLLDQLSRNCFREEEQAVVYRHYDRLARAVANAAMQAKLDEAPRWAEAIAWRNQFYMPSVHSEDLEAHEKLASIMSGLAEKARERGDIASAQFARRIADNRSHIDQIKRFGRFPRRNKWLGRKNTPEEEEYLAKHPATFGA